MLHQLLFGLVSFFCLGYAFRAGGWPERAAAAVMTLGIVLTLLVARIFEHRFTSIEIGVFAVDTAMLVAFFALALAADRFWPIWMTAMQAVSVMGHGAMAVSPDLIPWAYAFAVAVLSYPMMILLAVATKRHRQRLAASGADVSWSSSWRRTSAHPRSSPKF